MSKLDRWAWMGLAVALCAVGCSSGETKPELSEKDAFDAAAKELADSVGTIAAFEPYLVEPEEKPYAPIRRPDLLKSQFFAATAIRHAANFARQRGERSQSKVTLGLTDALAKLSRACTDPGDAGDVAKCGKAVKAFDKELESNATKASGAGASAKFPRVAAAFITENAKKELAPFKLAMGPGPKEKEYLAKRSDEKATIDDLMSVCGSAKAEVSNVASGMEGKQESVRELAVVHKYAVDTQCNRFGSVIKAHAGLEICGKTKTPECRSACGKMKRIIDQGLPAAAFKSVEADYEKACVDKK